ncbi:MAG: thioredoxin 2 [Candidatus Methanolliviera sp. GoM_asphalt]|nr:MAG: thioredoxin 2 [Candidatus Methanolliviera sp. GoM_asphalt]
MDEIEEIKKKMMKELMDKMETEKNFPDGPVNVGADNFSMFISKYPNVVVDCWAEWCGPCKMVSPVIEALSKDYKGKIAFGKMNTDENQRLAMQFGITAIPTMLVFKDGKMIDNIVGAMPKEILEKRLMKVFGVM